MNHNIEVKILMRFKKLTFYEYFCKLTIAATPTCTVRHSGSYYLYFMNENTQKMYYLHTHK